MSRAYANMDPRSRDNSYIELHPSNLFFTKGNSAERNGVVLTKTPANVQNIEVLDEHLETINVPWKVYYFHENDSKKMVLVTTRDGETYEFIYNVSSKQFEERHSQLLMIWHYKKGAVKKVINS